MPQAGGSHDPVTMFRALDDAQVRAGPAAPARSPSARRDGRLLRYWALFLFVAVVIASILAAVAFVLYEQAEAAAIKNSTNLLNIVEGRMIGTLQRLQAIIDATAESVTPADLAGNVPAARRAELNQALRARLALFPEALQLSVTDATGRQRYAGVGDGGADFSTRDWFTAAREHPDVRLQYSKVVTGVQFPRPIMALVRPLTDADGRFFGAVSAPLDVGAFQSTMASLDLGPKGIIAIRRTDHAELVIRVPPLNEEVNRPVASPLTTMYKGGALSGTLHFASPVDGVGRMWQFRRLAQYPFVVTVALADDDYLATARRVTVGGAVAALLLLALIGALLMRSWRSTLQREAHTAELASREARFRAVLTSMEEGVLVQGEDGRIALCNDAAERILDSGEESILGSTLEEACGPAMREDGHPIALGEMPPARSMRGGHTAHGVVGFARRDGSTAWLRMSAKPMNANAPGTPAQTLTTFVDITAERDARAALRRSEARFESIVATAIDGVLCVNDAGFLVLFNEAAQRIFLYAPEEAIGKPFAMLLADPDANPLAADDVSAIAAADADVPRVVQGRRRDGSSVPVEMSVSKFEVDGQRVYTAIVRDISERLRAEFALKDLNQALDRRVRARTYELEQANRDLEVFSYSVSHDMRAPVRAVAAYGALLAEERLPEWGEEAGRLVDKLRRSARRMEELIDDALLYSRSSRANMDMTDIALDPLVHEVCDELHNQYPAAVVEIGALGTIRGDRTMVRQIFTNLIGNALKYSSTVAQSRVRVDASGNIGSLREFYVRDNGVGFKAEHAKNLFGLFQRLHNDSRFPGTGVGLAVVRRLVERHGGAISGESDGVSGATFRFTLPGGA